MCFKYIHFRYCLEEWFMIMILARVYAKKNLPEPNPIKIEISKECTLKELYAKAYEMFFNNINTTIDDLMLGDSSGTPITICDNEEWTVRKYYQSNNFQPSRHKLYIIAKVKVHIN